ncbi:MAG: hypothetical protein Q9214_001526 [Letrouitia sp. 1 TL-2023]
MDPGTIVAVIQVASKVLSLISKYYLDVKDAKADIEHLINQITVYRKILQNVERLVERGGSKRLPAASVMAIKESHDDIKSLEERLTPSKRKKAMSRLGRTALTWPFSKDKFRECVTKIEKHIASLNLALNCDQTSLVLKIDESQELSQLSVAEGAAFDSFHRQNEPRCISDTRVDILNRLYEWSQMDDRCIFWLNGMAGTGKSTIARTIAANLDNTGSLGANFFFSRGVGDLGHAGRFVTTLAHQLANTIPLLKPYICKAITNNPRICYQDLRKQWKELIIQPLLDSASQCPPLTFVIDALDECDDEANMKLILQLFVESDKFSSIRLGMIVTSRPETPIRLGFKNMPEIIHEDLILHNVPRNIVEHDIFVFLDFEFAKIGRDHSLENWPDKKEIDHVVRASDCLFIYAATVCRFIKESSLLPPEERLEAILQNSDARGYSAGATANLDEMYVQILQCSFKQEGIVQDGQRFRYVVGSIVVLSDILSVSTLSNLLGLSRRQVEAAISPLHSLLNVPNDPHSPVRLLHPSFRDFLLDKDRCKDDRFLVDRGDANKSLASACLQLLVKTLKEDICDLKAPGATVSDLQPHVIDSHLPKDIQYACQYWVDHLEQATPEQRIEVGLCDNGQIDKFFHVQLLHWLEALSIVRKVSEGVKMLVKLELMLQNGENPYLLATVYDAKRFLLSNRAVLEDAPLQLYTSALLFSPEKSLTRVRYYDESSDPIRMYPHSEATWGPCLQALEVHANTVAFSRDGLLASGSPDSSIRLWDPATGSLLCTLEGHSELVNALAFSPNGNLASGSGDETVRLWDPSTGALLSTLRGHSSSVNAVAFSPDGKLASGSADKTVRLWDPTTRSLQSVFDGHSGSVYCLAFSLDGKLASGSDDTTIRLWDLATGSLLRTLEGHSNYVSSIEFMPNGKLVSAGWDNTVQFWDIAKGALINVFETKSGIGAWSHLAFSLGSTLAIAERNMIQLYSQANGVFEALGNFSRKTSTLESLPDSEQVARASDEQLVRLYDQDQKAFRSLEGHSSHIWAIAFSSDGLQLASAGNDGTIRLWDPHERADESKSAVSDQVTVVAFSPNGKQLASNSKDSVVQLWDPVTGSLLRSLKGHSEPVKDIVFSASCQQLASASWDRTVRLWNVANGEAQAVLKVNNVIAYKILFSPDCAQLATYNTEYLQLWDIATGQQRNKHMYQLNKLLVMPGDMALSPKDSQLALISSSFVQDNSQWEIILLLWDYASGTLVEASEDELQAGFENFVITYSLDGKLLALASFFKTILWDPIRLQKLHVFNIECVKELSFSNDGSRLYTDRGLIQFSSASTCDASEQSIPRIWSLERGWLLLNGKKVLWIHPNYRPKDREIGYARSGDRVAFIHSSGRIFYLHFSSSILAIQPRVIATIDMKSS